jgi:uncharacterized membrane protein
MRYCYLCGQEKEVNSDGFCKECMDKDRDEPDETSQPIVNPNNRGVNTLQLINYFYGLKKLMIVFGIIVSIILLIVGIFSFNAWVIVGSFVILGYCLLYAHLSSAVGKIIELLNDIKNK